MRTLGADPILVPSDDGQITADLFARMKARLAREISEPGVFCTDQFHNDDVIRGYMPMGDEILRQTGSGITAFCAAAGTAWMLVGVSRALKAAQCTARIIPLEPAESPMLSTGQGGSHRVYDEIRTVDESAARAMARRLAREEGILACDSGLKYLAERG